jgi:hypothetical protein
MRAVLRLRLVFHNRTGTSNSGGQLGNALHVGRARSIHVAEHAARMQSRYNCALWLGTGGRVLHLAVKVLRLATVYGGLPQSSTGGTGLELYSGADVIEVNAPAVNIALEATVICIRAAYILRSLTVPIMRFPAENILIRTWKL